MIPGQEFGPVYVLVNTDIEFNFKIWFVHYKTESWRTICEKEATKVMEESRGRKGTKGKRARGENIPSSTLLTTESQERFASLNERTIHN